MSKFFRALEQAERDRLLREQAGEREGGPVVTSSPGSAAVSAPPAPGAPPVTTPAAPPVTPPRDRRPEHRHVQPESQPLKKIVRRADPLPVRDLPADAGGVDAHLVSLLTPTAFEAEQYRALRHVVEQLYKSANFSVIAVSSPSLGDGKTTTAINLAGALAQGREARVLLVDGDLRQPTVARYLGLEDARGRGLVDVILNPSLTLDHVVRTRTPFNLSVIPAGRPSATAYEVLKSPRLGELLQEARRRYDYVVLDTPPLVPVLDCRVMGNWVDGFLLVVAADRTPRRHLEEALNMMDPAKLVGLVFNGDATDKRYYAYARGDSSNEEGSWARAMKKVLPFGQANRE